MTYSSGVAGGARGPGPPSEAYFLGLGGRQNRDFKKKKILLSIFFVFNYQKLDSTKKIYQILSLYQQYHLSIDFHNKFI